MVLDHQHGAPHLVGDVPEDPAQLVGLPLGDPGRGLVEDHEPRLGGHLGADVAEVAGARGELVGGRIGERVKAEPVDEIDARRPAGLTVRSSRITGHGVAGVSVRDCEACGARVEGLTIEDNAAGVVAVAATGVVVRGTTLRDNAVGIVLRDVLGGQVTGNTLADNDATDIWVASALDGVEAPVGAGVWISGGRANLVAANHITGHTYNVAVTGPAPSLGHRIVGNTVGHGAHADLGWDGLGSGVCFSRNRRADAGDTTADPPWSSQLYDCSLPATVGAPYPVVVANLARHASAAGYP